MPPDLRFEEEKFPKSANRARCKQQIKNKTFRSGFLTKYIHLRIEVDDVAKNYWFKRKRGYGENSLVEEEAMWRDISEAKCRFLIGWERRTCGNTREAL